MDERLSRAYSRAGVPERWKIVRYHTGHFQTAHGRREVMAFLERWL